MGIRLCYLPPQRKSTRTRVSRESERVMICDVFPTDRVKSSRMWSALPIIVIRHQPGFYGRSQYFVIDGNHRLFYRKKRGDKKTDVWILKKSDRKLITGNLPYNLKDWVDGKINFTKLKLSAMTAGESVT